VYSMYVRLIFKFEIKVNYCIKNLGSVKGNLRFPHFSFVLLESR